MSSSFFLKAKPKQSKKRKVHNDSIFNKREELPKRPKTKDADDEEIHSSDEEELSATQEDNLTFNEELDYLETAQDKRLKQSKIYLEELEKEERARAEDKDVFDAVSNRLTKDYLENVGKLRHKLADEYCPPNVSHIKTLKHKLHQLPVTTICVSANNDYLFSGNKSHVVLKWDLKTLKVTGHIDTRDRGTDKYENAAENPKFRPHTWCMALSTDFKFLAIGNMTKEIHIWCPQKLVHLHTFRGHADIVTGLVFRKDSHDLYSVSKDRSMKVWSLNEMIYVETLFGHQAAITAIDALSRERAITAGGSDSSIRIWKIVEETQLIYNGHGAIIEAVKLINEENFFSSGNDGSLCIWSALKKKPLCIKQLAHGTSKENGQPNWISAIATQINTDVVASGSCDGFIRVWKLANNFRELALLFEVAVNGFINSLTFTNDGNKLIASVGQEHRLGRWWSIKEAKNSIVIIPLSKHSDTEIN